VLTTDRRKAVAGAAMLAVALVAALAAVGIFGHRSTGPATPGFTCERTLESGGNIAIAAKRVSSGGTVCLNAGTYSFSSTISKASMTTVRPAHGVGRAQVTFTQLDVQTSRNLRFVGVTARGGNIGSSSAAATNIQLIGIKFTEGVCLNQPTAQTNLGILIDSSTLTGTTVPGCGGEGRIQVTGRDGPKTNAYHAGIVISRNLFSGPTRGSTCTDGIQFTGQATGIDVIDNEFADIVQSACGAMHGDPIQFFGGRYVTIAGNYFHGNSSGIMDGDCAGNPKQIVNNVFVNHEFAANVMRLTGAGGDVIKHNTMVGSAPFFGDDNCATHASGMTITDNVFGQRIQTFPGASWSGTNDYNLVPGGGGGVHGIAGVPAFAGGRAPRGYAGHALAAGSPGRRAADDGKDIGIEP
jgi:hypothetical protein